MLDRGSWLFRNDVVTVKQLEGPTDLNEFEIQHVETWVQFHRLPLEAMSPKRLLMVARKIGMLMSDVREAYTAGRKICQGKIIAFN